jgi:hypothetical protein
LPKAPTNVAEPLLVVVAWYNNRITPRTSEYSGPEVSKEHMVFTLGIVKKVTGNDDSVHGIKVGVEFCKKERLIFSRLRAAIVKITQV